MIDRSLLYDRAVIVSSSIRHADSVRCKLSARYHVGGRELIEQLHERFYHHDACRNYRARSIGCARARHQ